MCEKFGAFLLASNDSLKHDVAIYSSQFVICVMCEHVCAVPMDDTGLFDCLFSVSNTVVDVDESELGEIRRIEAILN